MIDFLSTYLYLQPQVQNANYTLLLRKKSLVSETITRKVRSSHGQLEDGNGNN